MSITFIGVLAIGALVFLVTVLVTMALAAGPVLLCRVFANPGTDNGTTQPRASSLASSVLTLCCTVVGLGIGLFMLYFTLTLQSSPDESAATVVDEDHGGAVLGPPAHVMVHAEADLTHEHIADIPMDVAEHSMFAPPFPTVPPQHVTTRTSLRSIASWAFVLPLAIIAVIAVVSKPFRSGLARAVPVLMAVGLLGVLFFWTTARQEPQQVFDHHSVATTAFPPQALKSPLPPAPGGPWQQSRSVTLSDQSTQRPVSQSVTVQKEQAVVAASSTKQAATPPENPQNELPVLAYIGVSAEGVPHKTLPTWVDNSDKDAPIRVIESGLHATVKLAEEHALEELKTLLCTEMVRREPQAAGWQPSDQIVLNGGNILQRAVERTQIEVGDNTIPMYEAYWQVDLGRLEALYQAWRPSVVQRRLLQIGGGMALIMLLLSSIAGVLRVDEQTNGQRRKSLAAGTLALWAAVGALALFVA